MTGIEMLVVPTAAVVGYWVVAKVLGGQGGNRKGSRTAEERQARPGRTDAPRASPTPAWAEVLGVPHTADSDAIRTAYRQLIVQYHPDKVVGLGPELQRLAEEKTKTITAAYYSAIRSRGSDVN